MNSLLRRRKLRSLWLKKGRRINSQNYSRMIESSLQRNKVNSEALSAAF
jgi:hypothetical protein